jgi:DNA-binding LytR/AlgR family response regulator
MAAVLRATGYIWYEQCHRSVTVNIRHIERIKGMTLIMSGGAELSTGREFRASLFRRLRFVGTEDGKYVGE